MEKNLEFIKQSLIAHRGMHNIEKGIPENSIEAFKEAINNKYIIELDVHILKDNSIIVFHDDNLKRMTGLYKEIKKTTYEEIKKLKLQNTNSHIPLLEEVLELINKQVPIIIELKSDVKCGRLEKEIIKKLKNYKGKYVVKSFNPISVYWLKRHNPEIIRGQLVSNYKNENLNSIKKFILKNMLFNCITKPDFLSCEIDFLQNKKVKRFRKSKRIVLGWTIRNKQDFMKAKKYCDNYICENLDNIKYYKISEDNDN